MAIDFSKYGTPTAPGQPTTGGTFSKYGTPVETPPDITNDETFWSKFRSGQPTFPVDRNDGIVTNVAKTLGNVPSSYMKIAGGVLDAPEIYKASKDIAEQNDKSMLKTQVAVTKSLVEDLWSLAKKGYEGWENVGQKIYSDLERNTLDQKSVTEGVKITGAQYTGKALEVILNDPLLIPTLFYAPNRLKGTGLTVEKTADGGKVLKTTQGEVVTVMDKSGDIVFGKKPPQDIITKVARPVIDTVKAGTASVARKALPTYEESVAKVANTYKDALPLTPSQKLDEEILLKKTGSNVYRTLAEEGIPLGTGDEVVKLQSISDKISDLSSVYSKEETALFSIKRILEDFEKHIEKNLQTPSARISALKKIKSEVEMVVSDVKNKVDVVTDAQGNILVKAPIADRLRKMGNEIGKYKDPENLGKSIGWGFSNAVRDEVERMSQFPAYRELNRRWGATIHAQQVLDDIEKAGKKFRRVGGLSGSMAQRILSGLFGYHMAGIPGAILSELGSEYAAAVLSNPKLRTWFSRRVLDLHLDDTPSDKAIKQLKAEIDAYKAKVDENMKKGLALPAPSNKTPIPLGAKPDESGITVTEAERIVVRNPKTGKFERAYTSQSLDSEKRVQNQAIENAPAIKNKNSISPTVPPKATPSTPLSTLEAEAKKYKTAEEFTDAMMYHGTLKDNIPAILKEGLVGNRGRIGKYKGNEVKYVSFADDPDNALNFATGRGGDAGMVIAPKPKAIYDLGDIRSRNENKTPQAIEFINKFGTNELYWGRPEAKKWLADKGYEAISFMNPDGITEIRILGDVKDVFEVPDGFLVATDAEWMGKPTKHFSINKEVLTDIWNKANKASNPLYTEAKKYKSAEEFVKAPKYKTTVNIQDKNDLEYLEQILSRDSIEDIKNGKMTNWRGDTYEDLARVNIVSETPKTIAQQLEGRVSDIKLKSNTFYHGTSAENAQGIMNKGFKTGGSLPKSTFRGGGYGKMQNSISLAETPKEASIFSELTRNGEIVEVKLKDNAKVVSIKGVEDATDLEDYISYLKKEKVDAVYIGGGEKELVVINPKTVIPTKSQLTDIWNKANKASNPLYTEAKKYKSAEEFVKAQPVVYHGSGVPLKKFNNKQGTFFTDDMMNADGYAGGENVYEGYLNLKNPLVIDAKGALHRELDTKWGKTTQEVVGNVDKTKYDGVIFKNIKDSWIDDAEYDTPSTIYYAFKPADAFLNESQLTDIWKKANGK